MIEQPQPQQWTGKTGGTPWMQRTLIACLGWMNLPFVYAGMSLVIPFYMLFYRPGYLAQYRFFRRRLHYGRFRSFVNVYANHFLFGAAMLDRFAAYGGAKFKITVEGNEYYWKKLAEPGGFLQLSSHFGNFEMAGYMLSQDVKQTNAIIYGGETDTITEHRKRLFREMNIHPIIPQADLSHIYAINSALERGEIISMPGDRKLGSQKQFRCRFFDGHANFPMGPYLLAASKEVPLVSIFVLKEGVKRYRIFVEEVTLPDEYRQKPTRQRAAALAQAFAEKLEHMVRKYPRQWFNYYDFWEEETADVSL